MLLMDKSIIVWRSFRVLEVRALKNLFFTIEINRWPLVPLILVFTKFDKHESDEATAYMKCEEHRRSLFGNVRHELVSSNYCFTYTVPVVWRVALFSAQPKYRDLIEKLVTTTDEVISAHSRETQPQQSPVTLAWSVSQRASRDINVQGAIERVTSFSLLNLFSHTVQQSWAKQWVEYVTPIIKANSKVTGAYRILAWSLEQ